MTGRERIEAAFSENGTPEIPVVLPYEDLYVRDKWEQLTSCPWWWQFEPDIGRQMQWRLDVKRCLKHDWFDLPLFYSREERENIRIEHREDGVFRVDKRTGKERRLSQPRVSGWDPSGGVQSFRPEHLASTPDEIDKQIPVAPIEKPSEIMWDGRDDLAKAILNGFGADLYPIARVSPPLWACYGLWGFEGMMIMIATQTELVRYACERLLPSRIQTIHEAASLGASAIWIEECLTDQISPEAFAALSLPFVRQLVDAIRAVGLKSVYYFCGDPAGKWEYLLAAGADALALEESKKGFTINIENVVEIVKGRCALLGNLDAVSVLQNGVDEQLRAEIARQIAAGRKNNSRFIMSVGSPVTPGTPVERVRLYCDLARGIGGAG